MAVVCAIILSFLGATEMGGVTSMCRYWLSDGRGYHRLLHFFVPGLTVLNGCGLPGTVGYCPMRRWKTWRGVWCWLVTTPMWSRMRADAGRGVVAPETQSKPDYFRGQCWGCRRFAGGSLSACFCLPLSLKSIRVSSI
ncbi:MAG: hypothetical protein R3E93_04730 [Thiothrix sp.]